MDKFVFGKKFLANLFVMIFILTGCLSSDLPTKSRIIPSAAGNGGTTPPPTDVNSSIGPKIEIRHLIEPNLSTDPTYSPGTGFAGGGSYVRKLTLPKNFVGKLYVAGINIGTLAERHVKVRFKFGVNREAITLPATVTQAPGITPQTNISVLVIDMRSEPFRNIRLPYDLYDYNEYGSTDSPVQDNRDSGLYCRGLRLEDDPTFVGVGQCDGLQADEECLYAYAKVMDQGLVRRDIVNNADGTTSVVLVPTSPDLPQVASSYGMDYLRDNLSQAVRRTLPDSAVVPFEFSKPPLTVGATDSYQIDFLTDWVYKLVGDENYFYRGPYRLVNSDQWHFKFTDLSGSKRLFAENSEILYNPYVYGPLPDDPYQAPPYSQYFIYYKSLMFPRATQIDLPAGVEYLGSTNWNDSRQERSLSTAGKTEWMDGSNARAQSRNQELEHIGSCNVSASIEILAKDDNNNEYIVSLADDVKLQLVRPIQHFTDTGNDVLYTNFKTCTSNSTCGGSECCFNNRCWDQSLVSQCYDSTTGQGNQEVGSTCQTDLECTSLCCNRTSGTCAPHNTLLNPAVLCSKPIGDFCIAKEWCQKSPVTKCLVVRTGTDSLGNVTCRQQCYTTLENGDCKGGVCTPPIQEAIPVFDPNDPDRCDGAVPPPSF